MNQLGALVVMEIPKVSHPGVGTTSVSVSFIKRAKRLRRQNRQNKPRKRPQVLLLSLWTRRWLMVAANAWVVLLAKGLQFERLEQFCSDLQFLWLCSLV